MDCLIAYDYGLAAVGIALIFSMLLDFKHMRIPNSAPVVILSAFIIVWALEPQTVAPIEARLMSALGMLFVTFAMFSFGVLGAGDSKLLAALGLWLPLEVLLPYLLIMALYGAGLSVVSLMLKRRKIPKAWSAQSVWLARLSDGKSVVPYGIAIGGGFWTVWAMGLI